MGVCQVWAIKRKDERHRGHHEGSKRKHNDEQVRSHENSIVQPLVRSISIYPYAFPL